MPVPIDFTYTGTPNTGVAPLTVQFSYCYDILTNGTCDPLPGGVTLFWDFGDGHTVTDFNPTHTYLNAGTYTVSCLPSSFVPPATNTIQIIVTQPNYVELPVQKLTADQYGAIGTKNITAAFPYKFYENGNYPLRTVTVWPIPNRCHKVKLWLWQPLINAVDLDTDMQFPQGYERALRFALAVELAAEFGKEVPANVRSIAKMAKATVKRLNSTPQILKGDIAIASDQNNMFNYITGDTIPTNM